jgi:hypothetical protein
MPLRGYLTTTAFFPVLKLAIEVGTLSRRLRRNGITNQDRELAGVGIDLDTADREPGGSCGLQQTGG